MDLNNACGSASSPCQVLDELECLYRVCQVLSGSLDVRETLDEVLQLLGQCASLDLGLVTILNDRDNSLLVSASTGNKALGRIRYEAGEGLLGEVAQAGDLRIIQRPDGDPRFLNRLGLFRGHLPMILVPIRSGGAVRGVLALQSSMGAAFDERLTRFVEMVGSLMGQVVELARQVEGERMQLREERDDLRRRVRHESGIQNMVGRTARMRLVFEQVRQVAKWNTTVLIRGESGTGKELIAEGIHYASPRVDRPLVKLNCAALPDTLLESELFGHEKGAFTGATGQRKGRFEQADTGTLFLDEIGEITPAFQAKLLRVLQEGEFERVGGNRTLKVDVRVVAATNKNLEMLVKAGEFREDLYYRLNVMPIQMPALRERKEDLPELADFLVKRIAASQGRELVLDDSALKTLMRHDWPGNVRELANSLERAAVMSEGGRIDQQALRLSGLQDDLYAEPAMASAGSAQVDLNDPDLDERERIIAALEQAGWVQAKAARLLGMTPRQIAYRIQIMDIPLKTF